MKEYDLELKEVKFAVKDAKTKERQEYILRELPGTLRDQYLNELGARMRTGPKGETLGMKSFDGYQSSLLSKCIFSEDGKAVEIQVLQGWPSSVLRDLFDQARELSGLEAKKSEEEAKND